MAIGPNAKIMMESTEHLLRIRNSNDYILVNFICYKHA